MVVRHYYICIPQNITKFIETPNEMKIKNTTVKCSLIKKTFTSFRAKENYQIKSHSVAAM